MKIFIEIALLSSLLLSNIVHGQTTCASTSDCEAGAEYCADGTCIAIGSCQREVDCFNQENALEVDDCIGYLECTNNQCTKTCSQLKCPPGSALESELCPTVMCDLQNCEGAVSCTNYHCDDCHVLYFDAKGSQICDDFYKGGLATPSPGDPLQCSSNEDCRIDIGGDLNENVTTLMALGSFPVDQSYCAGGTCAAPGTCSTDNDCVNPSNGYEIIECVGPIVCQEGQCTRDCGTGSMCKEGETQLNCLVNPCEVTGCPESTGCVADYCSGGCNALHFDAAGNVLEECNGPFLIPFTCTQDAECNGSGAPTHYCSAGSCKPMGMCESTTDCLNPSNEVNFVTCTGYHECKDKQCGHVCSNDEHCCFAAAKCTEDDMEACPDAATCVKDNCNDSGDHCGVGTGSLYFDGAGNSICVEVESSAPTMAPTKKPSAGPAAAGTDLADGASSLSLMAVVIAAIATWMV